LERLPQPLHEPVALAQDWQQSSVHFDAVLQHGDATALLHTAATLAGRPGPIVGLTGLVPGDWCVPLERLVTERSLSINTAAAGGNASLMTIG
jgi:RHH-type proline utilization regulon transcriptional repressor/proline dehydrogenase/delta 1-pyrroline-5-carboxylate dehydrogenase